MSGFVIASKQMAKAKVAMIGPSGSGKTYSALRLARGLTSNGRVGVLIQRTIQHLYTLTNLRVGNIWYCRYPPPYTARKYLDPSPWQYARN